MYCMDYPSPSGPFSEPRIAQSVQKFFEDNMMPPQKRTGKMKAKKQTVNLDSNIGSPVKRTMKKPPRIDMNKTFVSYSPQKKQQNEIPPPPQLNYHINPCYQQKDQQDIPQNILGIPDLSPTSSQESPPSSSSSNYKHFPDYQNHHIYPKVELTRCSTPSLEYSEQSTCSFFQNFNEEEDFFMYAAWKKDVESPYFVHNHNGKRKVRPEAVNDTLIGNISPKNFPRFTYVDPHAYEPQPPEPKPTPLVYIRQYYYPIFTPPHLMPQVHQMHPNIMDYCNPYSYLNMNSLMQQPSEFMARNPYYPVVMKQYTQYQYPSAPPQQQARHPGQPTVIEQHQFVPVPSPYPGAIPNYFY